MAPTHKKLSFFFLMTCKILKTPKLNKSLRK